MKSHIILGCFLVPVALLASTLYASKGWDIQTVDNSGDTGYYSSIAYDSQGYPHIVYYNSSTRSLMYARWTGEGWQCETIQQSSYSYYFYGQYCSIAIDDEDKPHVAYCYRTTRFGDYCGPLASLMYAFKDNDGWHITTVHDGCIGFQHYTYYGYHTSIAVSRDPNMGTVVPHIAYYAEHGGDLWHAWRDTEWNKEIVDGAGDVGLYTSIALDYQQHIYISYYDAGGQDLKFAYYDGSQWGTQIIDDADAVGKYSSLVLDALGIVHITYYDETNGQLKHASLTLE